MLRPRLTGTQRFHNSTKHAAVSHVTMNQPTGTLLKGELQLVAALRFSRMESSILPLRTVPYARENPLPSWGTKRPR